MNAYERIYHAQCARPLTASQIHAEQQQRNRERFGTETYPGNALGDWPDELEEVEP